MESSNEIARDIRELEGLAKERIWIEGEKNANDQEQGCHRQENPLPRRGRGHTCISAKTDGQLTLPTHGSTAISHLYKNRKQ